MSYCPMDVEIFDVFTVSKIVDKTTAETHALFAYVGRRNPKIRKHKFVPRI